MHLTKHGYIPLNTFITKQSGQRICLWNNVYSQHPVKSNFMHKQWEYATSKYVWTVQVVFYIFLYWFIWYMTHDSKYAITLSTPIYISCTKVTTCLTFPTEFDINLPNKWSSRHISFYNMSNCLHFCQTHTSENSLEQT